MILSQWKFSKPHKIKGILATNYGIKPSLVVLHRLVCLPGVYNRVL